MARWVAAARAAQQDALRELQALDAAIAQNMTHGAMAGHDPLTDSIFDQADAAAACAIEGPVPPCSTNTGLTRLQMEALASSQADDWWLDMLVPATLTLSVVAYVGHLLGWW